MKKGIKLGISRGYLLAFFALLVVVVLIAVFGTSGFIRYHFGDIIIVILIYCFIRSFVKNRMKWLPLAIFIFSVLVEIGQYFHIVERLGLADIAIARVAIGMTFDPWDIVMYFIGCVLLYVYEVFIYRNTNATTVSSEGLS
ncbi:MAG: DUF2809 domain-containing protein [Defluviitaleaceae bacterium]|nr:DUF2809 domain-containing protein [Defluviitaleaceae bacterium]